MTEKELIELYRKQLANQTERAPDGVWENIADQLDVELVWDNISRELGSNPKRKFYTVYLMRAAAIAVIISLGVITNYFIDIDLTTSPNLATSSNITTPDHDASENIQTESQTIPPAPKLIRPGNIIADEEFLLAQEVEKESVLTFKDIIESNLLPDNYSIGRQLAIQENENQLISPVYPEILIAQNLPGLAQLIKPEIQKQPDLAFHTEEFAYRDYQPLSFGLTTSIKNTWLFNNETFEGFDRYNHNRTDIKFHPDFGFNIKYRFSQKWSIESGMFISSLTGQSYRQFIQGTFSRKEISLNYFQLELLGSYTGMGKWFGTEDLLRLNSMAGIYVSSLNSAYELINGERRGIEENYKGADFGFIFGQHIDLELGSRITFSPGIRLKWGLSNIYHGKNNIPSGLTATQNRSIEFRLNLYYNPRF